MEVLLCKVRVVRHMIRKWGFLGLEPRGSGRGWLADWLACWMVAKSWVTGWLVRWVISLQLQEEEEFYMVILVLVVDTLCTVYGICTECVSGGWWGGLGLVIFVVRYTQ